MPKEKNQIWGGRLNAPPSELNLAFCAGRDVRELPPCDQRLVPFDIRTNLAHARMLTEVGVLSNQEWRDIHQGLSELARLDQTGGFKLNPAKEDVHINVEHWLTFEKGIGAAKKIHSGRSRNDQVSTDMRLYLREELLELAGGLASLIAAVLKQAQQGLDWVMPGFTHYQPAMITTMGHWLASWGQGLSRDLVALGQVYAMLDKSPLGAAAGFGTSWPLQRERSAELLGFSGVEENSLDCIASRGEAETRIVGALAVLLNRLGQMGQDLILWSHPYFGFVTIHDAFVTGSSIMPQKRNPDFAEVLRAKAAQTQGALSSLLGVQKGAMSGYNRDSQQSKSIVMDVLDEIRQAAPLMAQVVVSLTFHPDEMAKKAQQGFMNAADVADWLAREKGVSFRQGYEALSLAVKYAEASGELTLEALNQACGQLNLGFQVTQREVDALNDPLTLLGEKRHTGAPAPSAVRENLAQLSQSLTRLNQEWVERKERIEQARAKAFAP